MDRRAFIGTLALGLLAVPLAAEAQQTGNVFRVGILGYVHMQPAPYEMFREGLSQLGYTEGQQVVCCSSPRPSRRPRGFRASWFGGTTAAENTGGFLSSAERIPLTDQSVRLRVAAMW